MRFVQPLHRAPEVGEHVVSDEGRLRVGEHGPVGRPHDQERGAGTRSAGHHDRRDAYRGAIGEEQGVGLVLDVLEPREVERRSAVFVEEEAPEFGEELRVGFVATEHAHAERALIVLGDHECAATWGLGACELDVASVDAELHERGADLRAGRPSTGRAEREVHRGGDAPAEHDGREHVVGEPGAEVERRAAIISTVSCPILRWAG